VELLTTRWSWRITERHFRGDVQGHQAQCGKRGRTCIKKRKAVNDAELFTRLYYYGTVQMGMSAEDYWIMPIGLFLDLWLATNNF
jgi:hypothetical protein